MQNILNQAHSSVLIDPIGKIGHITAFTGKIDPITGYVEHIGLI